MADDDTENRRMTKMDKHDVRILLVDDDEDDYLLTHDLLADIPDSRFQLDWVPDPDAALETMCRNEAARTGYRCSGRPWSWALRFR